MTNYEWGKHIYPPYHHTPVKEAQKKAKKEAEEEAKKALKEDGPKI